MGLNPGCLNQQLTVLRKSTVREGTGFRESWAPVGRPFWAEVIGLNGREAVIGQALQGVSYYRITTWWRSDILFTDQLRYGDQVLNISSPPSDPDGKREQLQILADTGAVETTGAG